MQKAIVARVGNVFQRNSSYDYIQTIDLLPLSMELINIQDSIQNICSTGISPDAVLKMVLTPEVLSKYAYVLIDCPPNLGLIRKNGLLISDGYVVPVVPQRMSVIGLSMIETQVKEYAQNKEKVIPLLGVVFTKVRRLSSYDSIKKMSAIDSEPMCLRQSLMKTMRLEKRQSGRKRVWHLNAGGGFVRDFVAEDGGFSVYCQVIIRRRLECSFRAGFG